MCSNNTLPAQLFIVICKVTLSRHKRAKRSPPSDIVRNHGSSNLNTVHEVDGGEHSFALFERGNPPHI